MLHENCELTNQSNSIHTRTVRQEGMQAGTAVWCRGGDDDDRMSVLFL